MFSNTMQRMFALAVISGTALLGAGCGSSGFVPGTLTKSISASGSIALPPKVDFVIFVDNSSTINQGYAQLQSAVQKFLTTLDQQDWDYHVSISPLITKDYALSGVIGSKYDANSSPWTPPYPGASASMDGMIPATLFKTLTQYTVPSGDRSLLGNEPGLSTVENLVTQLLAPADTTKALRSDAIKVVTVISYGNDNSGLAESVMDQATGQKTVSSELLNFLPWKTQMQAQYGGRTGFQVFAAVSKEVADTKTGNLCHGTQPFVGTRYVAAADTSFDICKQDLSEIFTQIGSQLTVQRATFRTRYVFIEQDAESSSIQLMRHSNGIDTVIPSSSTDGWEYLGYQKDLYTIDSPALLNKASGYAIQLNGSARIEGKDSVSVSYALKGTKTVVTK